ncbi:MAG TPA: peptide ABC transporter ATP-binding protein, partial [Hyphomonas sp.]|nr:peptide ABC transporter ATP-binding protein [Hyphomonas sp.]
MAGPLLAIDRLSVAFDTEAGKREVLRDVTFDIAPGEVVGVVGESGSGKSVTMMSLLGLLPSPPAIVHGESVRFDGLDLLRCTPEQLRAIRGGRIGFIFQDPMTS